MPLERLLSFDAHIAARRDGQRVGTYAAEPISISLAVTSATLVPASLEMVATSAPRNSRCISRASSRALPLSLSVRTQLQPGGCSMSEGGYLCGGIHLALDIDTIDQGVNHAPWSGVYQSGLPRPTVEVFGIAHPNTLGPDPRVQWIRYFRVGMVWKQGECGITHKSHAVLDHIVPGRICDPPSHHLIVSGKILRTYAVSRNVPSDLLWLSHLSFSLAACRGWNRLPALQPPEGLSSAWGGQEFSLPVSPAMSALASGKFTNANRWTSMRSSAPPGAKSAKSRSHRLELQLREPVPRIVFSFVPPLEGQTRWSSPLSAGVAFFRFRPQYMQVKLSRMYRASLRSLVIHLRPWPCLRPPVPTAPTRLAPQFVFLPLLYSLT